MGDPQSGFRVWRQSLGEFLGDALVPIRRINSVVQELGVPTAGLVVFYVIGMEWGWRWAGIAVLGLLAILLGWEGVRREHERRAIRAVFAPVDPEPNYPEYGVWKLAVKVTSLTPAKQYMARCVGPVVGLLRETPAGDFTLPWEGRPGEIHTLRKDYPEQIPIGYLDANGRTIQFALPATIYSGPDQQSKSPSKMIVGEDVFLNLEVREVESEGFARASVTIHLDPNNLMPTISVGGPMPVPTPPSPPSTQAQAFIARILREQEGGSA
jgi:hypothetical protein